MMTNTVVFGDDESVAADVAWLWINSHVWPGWHLEVVHATVPAMIQGSSRAPELHEWTPDNPRRVFAEAQFGDVSDLSIEQDPRLALSRPATLLVVGNRGPGLAKALHIGSTTEWLLAHPPAPMLVARHGRRTRTALVCHDGSPHAWAATRALCQLPWIDGLNVVVVGVDDGRAEVAAAVADAARLLSDAGAFVRVEIRVGDPTDVLLDQIDRDAPDLIVLGTRGLTGIKRLKLGSTAGAVAHSTDHSILIACDDADEVASVASVAT